MDTIVVGSGTSGTPSGGVLTVQGITNGSPIPVTDPFDATFGSLNITTQDLLSTTTVGFANQSLITGTPTVNSSASFTINSIQTVMILISGTWTGTLSIEVSEDLGTTWEPRSIHVIGTSTFASSITANVVGSMNAAGKSNVRVRATTAITGTAVIKIVTSDNPSNVYIANSIKLVDGANTPSINMLTIKAGSTVSTLTDTAAVVTVRDIATQTDKTGSGTIAALNGTIVAITNGCSIVSFNVTGTWVATVVTEGTIDAGVTWFPIDADVDATDSIINSFTTNSLITINCASYAQVRLRTSLYTSGTLSASWEAGTGLSLVEIYNTNALSLKVTVVPPTLTVSSPTFATVGVTSASALSSNANRKGLVMTNTSSSKISLNISGGTAVINSGIVLYPGGNWYMDEFTFTTSAIFAIASTASSNLAIQEQSV